MKQLLSAVSFLHSKNIAHRNIHPENILFNSNDALNIKLLDFGSSRKMGPNEPLQGVYGTAYYVAPECMVGAYDLKCDVWSVGVVMYMLLSGKPPFNGATDTQILQEVKKGEYSLDGTLWE